MLPDVSKSQLGTYVAKYPFTTVIEDVDDCKGVSETYDGEGRPVIFDCFEGYRLQLNKVFHVSLWCVSRRCPYVGVVSYPSQILSHDRSILYKREDSKINKSHRGVNYLPI